VIDAIAVDIDAGHYDPDRKLENANDLLRICPGMIAITAPPSDGDDLSDDDDLPFFLRPLNESISRAATVSLAHFSVKEYLCLPRITQSCATAFAVLETRGHYQISKTCLIYLCNQDFLNQALTRSLIEQYPFARFAAEFWHHHYRLIDEDSATELEAWGMALFRTRAPLERWIRLYDVGELSDKRICYDERVKTYASPVYYASLLGLDGVLARILSASAVDVNARGGSYGTALYAASFGGHEKVVQMLLDHDADVNARGAYSDALWAASTCGHEKVVQILLDQGADPNVRGRNYGNALQAASSGGHEKVVQMLLDKGAYVNTQGEDYVNALHAATRGGHEKVVQMLLDQGADINHQGGDYCSPIWMASAYGYEKVLQILLDQGADVNEQGGYCSALQYAFAGGYMKIVHILLKHEAKTI